MSQSVNHSFFSDKIRFHKGKPRDFTFFYASLASLFILFVLFQNNIPQNTVLAHPDPVEYPEIQFNWQTRWGCQCGFHRGGLRLYWKGILLRNYRHQQSC